MGLLGRLIDILFFLYFVAFILIRGLLGTQRFCPSEWYPLEVREAFTTFINDVRDPLALEQPPWFKPFFISEYLFQLPFFFFAAYAFLRGYNKCPWIRIPAIVYTSHKITLLSAIFAHIFLHDFSDSKHPAPRNMDERLKLALVHVPFLIMSLFIFLRMVFCPPQQQPEGPTVTKGKKKN